MGTTIEIPWFEVGQEVWVIHNTRKGFACERLYSEWKVYSASKRIEAIEVLFRKKLLRRNVLLLFSKSYCGTENTAWGHNAFTTKEEAEIEAAKRNSRILE